MSAVYAFIVLLGLIIGGLVLWPQCPKCRKFGVVWNRNVEKNGKPWAVCSLCGHEWNPTEVTDDRRD